MAPNLQDDNSSPQMGMNTHMMLGYGYVPVQQLNTVYDAATGLRNGTIFPELNIPIDEYTRGIYSGL